MDIFSLFFNVKVCCVISLESPHRGNSNEYTKYTIINIKKKITPTYPKSAAMGLCSKGLKKEFKTAVVNNPSVFQAIEVLLYLVLQCRTIISVDSDETLLRSALSVTYASFI